MNQTHIDTRTRQSPASVEAALLDARKNHDAARALMALYPERPALVARALVSRDQFAARIAALELELGGLCQP